MFIAVEGVTGIGKSTLQSVLVSNYHSEPLIIDFEKHPYFEIPNLEPGEYVLEREMIFMLMGYHYLKLVNAHNKLVISDFIFDRFKVFAATALSSDDFESIFYPCFRALRSKLPEPNLVIRLVGPPTLVLSRIHIRNRGGEDYVTEDYLASLDQGFDVLFKEYQGCKTITINAEQYDFLNDPDAFRRAALLIESELPEMQTYRVA